MHRQTRRGTGSPRNADAGAADGRRLHTRGVRAATGGDIPKFNTGLCGRHYVSSCSDRDPVERTNAYLRRHAGNTASGCHGTAPALRCVLGGWRARQRGKLGTSHSIPRRIAMTRTKILWFGRPFSNEDKQHAEDHGFQLVASTAREKPDLQSARTAIFWATGPHFGEAAACLKSHVGMALDEGLHIVVIVSGESDDVRLRHVTKVLKDYDPHDALAARYRVRSEP